jgi:hypothetical protein
MGQSKASERSGGALRRPTGGKQMAPSAGRGSRRRRLKPEHGAYRSLLQRRGSQQRRAATRPLQRQLSGGYRTVSGHIQADRPMEEIGKGQTG